jgi:predicted transposase YbfD/YdcC
MVATCRPLIEVLSEIPDPRKARGKRHPLPAILALMCAAMLCGYRSYSAMAEWGRVYGPEFVAALGFTRPVPPCAATLCTVLRHLDRERFEAQVAAWAANVLTDLPPAPEQIEAIALDGKTLRGSRQQGASAAHLLAAVSHRLGLTLTQHAVDAKTNEIPRAFELLGALLVQGRVFTMDALLTQRGLAATIQEADGDYVMIVKGNQPQLWQDIDAVFQDPTRSSAPSERAQTVDQGHGRVEHRELVSSTCLVGYLEWPGAAQVFTLTRTRLRKRTGELSRETVYGVTSLPPQRADAATLLALTRAHWCIENRSHYVRDVTFGEDHSQVRVGSIPQVMAAVRNTIIGVLRATGETNIAAACRRYAAQPRRALALRGLPHDF